MGGGPPPNNEKKGRTNRELKRREQRLRAWDTGLNREQQNKGKEKKERRYSNLFDVNEHKFCPTLMLLALLGPFGSRPLIIHSWPWMISAEHGKHHSFALPVRHTNTHINSIAASHIRAARAERLSWPPMFTVWLQAKSYFFRVPSPRVGHPPAKGCLK